MSESQTSTLQEKAHSHPTHKVQAIVILPAEPMQPPPPPPLQPKAISECSAASLMTLAGAWLVQFCTFGYVNAFGVYQDFYTRDFLANKSPSDISWIGSLQLFLMYAFGIAVGRAFDGGFFHHLEMGGAVLYVFCVFMLSLAQPGQYYQVFLAQGVGMGIGLGLTFLPSFSIVSHHFRAHRALATGIVATGASAGGIVFPIMLNHLFRDPRMGFTGGVRASGGLIAGLLLIANAMMRTNYAPKASRTKLDWTALSRFVWDGAYLWSIIGAFLTNLGMFLPFFYFQLYAIDKGISESLAADCLTILNAGSIAGRLLPTALADRLGVYNIMLPAMMTSAALLFGMFGIRSGADAVVIAAIFGFSTGAYISLIPSLLAMLCTDMSELGLRMGLAFSAVAFANLIGNPIAGQLLGQGNGKSRSLTWWKALVFGGVNSYSQFVDMSH
ncbi:MFS general substrate transporter [Panus rudis PR-1116 ss-1]|nr:MFS general substrate transporter [Panus rudis PR-1116 ss-1]